MSDSDQEPKRSLLNSRKTVLGVAGLAVLGAGAILAVSLDDRDDDQRYKAISEPSASASAPGPTASPTGTAAADNVPVRASERPPTDQERIASAKANAKNSVKIQHPREQMVPPIDPSQLTVTESGSRQQGRTLRVVSARADLSGQNELGWVADKGRRVGPALCSQRVQFANQSQPSTKPTLLICWRTSATKSVYTVMVDMKGKPSRPASVAAIAKEWRRLG